MKYLENFNYLLLGQPTEKAPLVFLHGLMGYALNWKRIADAFKGTRQVLIYDQRGHGKSFQPEEGYAPEDYANDLMLILEELNWKIIDLIGHSMGGRNALNFASRFGYYVRKLVIEDIGPVVEEGSAERIKRLIELVPVPFVSKLEAKNFFMNQFPRLVPDNHQAKTLGQYFYSNLVEKELPPKLLGTEFENRVEEKSGKLGDGVPFYEDHKDDPDDRSFGDGAQYLSSNLGIKKVGTEPTNGVQKIVTWRFNKSSIINSLYEGRFKDRWEEWEQLSMPTLIIRGEKSIDLPSSTYKEMLRRNPLSEGKEVLGAGHWVHFDQPEAFIKLLREFLDKN